MKQVHTEGYTDVQYDDCGDLIVTSGSDGEVKIFSGFDDAEPTVHKFGDVVYAVAIKNERLYVANDMNAIQSYTIFDGMSDGIMLRFTAPSHQIVFNPAGDILIAGSSDTTIKCLFTDTKVSMIYEGHKAPVLSVALSPNEDILASSSCDGRVIIWDLKTGKNLKEINCLLKSNSFENSKTFARLAFSKSLKALFVPCESSVKVYSTEGWVLSMDITKPFMDKIIKMVSICNNEKYFAATTIGQIFLFEMETKKIIHMENINGKADITGISWHPNSRGLVYSTSSGQIGSIIIGSDNDVHLSRKAQVSDLFMDNDDDDDLMLSSIDVQNHVQTNNANPEPSHHLQNGTLPAQAQNFLGNLANNKSVSNRIQTEGVELPRPDGLDAAESNDAASVGEGMEEGSESGGIPGVDTDGEEEEEEALKPGGKKLAPMVFQEEDSNGDRLIDANLDHPLPRAIVKPSWEPTPMQPPFQSSATPFAYSRFMLWNEVGRIIQYDTDEEQSISVQFHEASVHHAIHINNSTKNYTIAALNTEVLLLASPADGDTLSQLFCMHFASWDLAKEWSASLPGNEDAECVAIGDGWVAVATSERFVRLFSFGGLQRQVFSTAGPMVCLAGQLDMLMLAYHHAVALPGDQCIFLDIFSINKSKKLASNQLPISQKSTLRWLGFSSEGTPFSVDSTGIVRMLNRTFMNTWTPVANLNDHCKSPSDHFWVVSFREEPQQIRAIFCKGTKYPSVLPSPIIQILPYKIPLCELTSEKSVLEEEYWRSALLSEHFKFWRDEDFDFDESDAEKIESMQMQLVMKMFALACRSQKEARCIELAGMLSTSRAVKLACKYAAQRGAVHLVQKLEEVASNMAEKEALQSVTKMSYLAQMTNATTVNGTATNDATNDANDDNTVEEDIVQDEDSKSNPIPRWKPRDENSKPISNKSLSTSQTSKLIKNPFKVFPSDGKIPSPIGSIIFDSIEVSNKASKTTSDNTLRPKKVNITQQKLFSSNNLNKNSSLVNSNSVNSKSAFELWLSENRVTIETVHPGKEADELTMVAAKIFKSLSKEVKNSWQSKANICENGQPSTDKKRKTDNEEIIFDNEKKRKI